MKEGMVKTLISSVLALWNKWRQHMFPNNQLPQVQSQAKKKLTKRQRIITTVILVLFMAAAFGFGLYYEVTGLYPIPFLNKSEDILPPISVPRIHGF